MYARLARLLLSIGCLCLVSLRPALAQPVKVTIDSTPAGAAVYIDGKEQGIRGYTGAGFSIRLPRGAHRVHLEAEGYKPLDDTINATPGQKFVFRLQKAPAQVEVKAKVTNASAAGAEVFIDGDRQGTVPAVMELAEGRHLLEARKPGYEPVSQQIELAPGESRKLWLTMEKKTAEPAAPQAQPAPVMMAPPPGPPGPEGTPVYLRARSPGSFAYEVSLGGRACVTPCQLAVPPGDTTLQVSGPRNFEVPLSIPAGQAQEVVIQHRTNGRIIAGAILLPFGIAALAGGSLLVVASDSTAALAGGGIVLAHGIAFFIAGVVELATIKRNRAIMRPLGQMGALPPPRLDVTGASALGATLPSVVSLRF